MHTSLRLFLTSLTAVAASSVALVAGSALVSAAPASDSLGYLDSTARCASTAETVVFGSTAESRVAICDTPNGLQYRGVRVRDGARLILSAANGGAGAYDADNDGITYTVTSRALTISAGSRTIREEPMVDFHAADSADEPAGSSAPSSTTTTTTTPTPTGPPLPAEVGGSGS
ncbi:hypothetical protein [Mycolicibacterium mengxianglii]|uniref:hypothetical protein n=1 Tax=Mycolicibacterium mengxianglii TaxID=2736649 RepID=UPI0018D17BED|nr:hypothetical protein [Mycolicibacterium mengxianglii]